MNLFSALIFTFPTGYRAHRNSGSFSRESRAKLKVINPEVGQNIARTCMLGILPGIGPVLNFWLSGSFILIS